MTLLEHLLQRGEKIGEERAVKRGELLGRIEMLTEWLVNQFPEFGDDDAARLRGMSNEGVFEVRSALKARQSSKTTA